MKYLFLIFHIILFSQNAPMEIVYDYEMVFPDMGETFNDKSYLLTNQNESIFFIDFTQSVNSKEGLIEIEQKDGSKTKVLSINENPYYYKDFDNNFLLSREMILRKGFLTLDKLNLFNWKINKEYKEILGFTCQQAKTSFRGREYTAWFTTEIPINNGPWKFQNLPGLILEVTSDDGFIHYTAQSVKTLNENVEIKNPFENKEYISRVEYENLFRKKYDELLNFKPGEGKSYGMSKGGIEIIIKD